MNSTEHSFSNQSDSGAVESTETLTGLLFRAVLGGFLMGLANLVPGISGGTMLLATGIYPRFVAAIAQISRLRFRRQDLTILVSTGAAAGFTILVFAGVIKSWVVDYPWIMYSLFVGLTLGGVPVVWSMFRRKSVSALISAAAGLGLMIAIAIAQGCGWVGNTGTGTGMLFVAGLAGASAMILPGISGGYLLLMLGQYVPILSAINQIKEALKAGDFGALVEPVLHVVIPVGVGVLIGVVLIGNLLAWLLKHYRNETLGFLLGLLVGSVAALYPFRQPVPPQTGQIVKGQVVTPENQGSFDREDWPVNFYRPDTKQAVGALALALAGFVTTCAIDRWGRRFRQDGAEVE